MNNRIVAGFNLSVSCVPVIRTAGYPCGLGELKHQETGHHSPLPLQIITPPPPPPQDSVFPPLQCKWVESLGKVRGFQRPRKDIHSLFSGYRCPVHHSENWTELYFIVVFYNCTA